MMLEQAEFHCQLEQLWAQSERRTKVLESLVTRAGSLLTPPPPLLVFLYGMGEEDDHHTFLEVFQATEVACCYPKEECALRLL